MTQHECANSRVRRWRRVVVTPATWLTPLLLFNLWLQPRPEAWLALTVLGLLLMGSVGYGVWLYRRWRSIEEYPARLAAALPFATPAPPFCIAREHEAALVAELQRQDARIIRIDSSEPDRFDLLLAIKLAAGAPTFWSPTRDHLRHGKLLGPLPRNGLVAVVWQGADRFAAADFAAFGRAIADLMELRLAQQPHCQVELFLLGDGAALAQRVRAAG